MAEPLTPDQLEGVRRADYVTFTSSSTVRFLLESLGDPAALAQARLVSIGPITSRTLREHGLEVHVEARRHDIDGLVAALLKVAAAQRASIREVPSTSRRESSA